MPISVKKKPQKTHRSHLSMCHLSDRDHKQKKAILITQDALSSKWSKFLRSPSVKLRKRLKSSVCKRTESLRYVSRTPHSKTFYKKRSRDFWGRPVLLSQSDSFTVAQRADKGTLAQDAALVKTVSSRVRSTEGTRGGRDLTGEEGSESNRKWQQCDTTAAPQTGWPARRHRLVSLVQAFKWIFIDNFQ